jgi:hypothetical protein
MSTDGVDTAANGGQLLSAKYLPERYKLQRLTGKIIRLIKIF